MSESELLQIEALHDLLLLSILSSLSNIRGLFAHGSMV